MAIGVRIAGVERPLRENSINIQHKVNERSTASFVLITDPLEDVRVDKRDQVELFDVDTQELLFKGFVDVVTERTVGIGNPFRNHLVICVDNHYLADKRIYAGAFENRNVSYIVESIANSKLTEEGITWTPSTIDGGLDSKILAISFNYERVSDIFSKLAERSGCDWWIDNDRVLYFKKTGAIQSGKILTENMVQSNSLSVTNTAHQYRNRQFIKGGKGTTDLRTESFKGDGSTKTFNVGFPIAQKPFIYVDGVEIPTGRIGIKGLEEDDGTYDWFWSKNTTEIVQANHLEPLTNSQVISISYRGFYSLIVSFQENTKISELAEKENSSGIVEVIDEEPSLDNKVEIFETALAKINKFSQSSNKVIATTLDSSFKVGTLVTIDLPSEGIFNDSDYLVESIEIKDQYPLTWFTITFVKGFIHESWAKMFLKMSKPSGDAYEITDVVDSIILTNSFTKIWQQHEIPNTLRDTYPGASLIVGSQDAILMFAPEHRNLALKVYNAQGDLLGTIGVAQRVHQDDQMTSLFIVQTNEAVGEWETIQFCSGTGLVKTVQFQDRRSKTPYEELQIELTDIKGW